MTETTQLKVTLPDDLVTALKERVASGRYRNESEIIIESLEALFDQDLDFETWLLTEVAEQYDELRADPTTAVSSEDLDERMKRKHAARLVEKRA